MLAKVSKIATSVMLGTLMLGAAGTAMAAENKTVLTLVAQQETAWVKNFNPFLQAGLLHTTRHFIYEPLVIFNDMQGGKPVYRLATNYAFSDDLKSVTFDLREGVKGPMVKPSPPTTSSSPSTWSRPTRRWTSAPSGLRSRVSRSWVNTRSNSTWPRSTPTW